MAYSGFSKRSMGDLDTGEHDRVFKKPEWALFHELFHIYFIWNNL
jgi:hypothetical protein